MVKKVNKLMITASILFAGVVGVNSTETVATNVNASVETSNMFVLTINWGGDNSNVLYVNYQHEWLDDFSYIMNSKTDIFGSKDVYINLKGTYNLFFTDHNNVFGDISADGILLRSNNVIEFVLNGGIVSQYHYIDILDGLNDAMNFYIVRNSYSTEYYHGYNVGYQEAFDEDEYNLGYNDGYDLGYDDGYDYGEFYGYNMGRHEFGIFFESQWRKAEWFGYFNYNLGYNDGLAEKDVGGFGGLLTAVSSGLGSFLSVQLLPNITIGAIVAVPLVFGIIFFILGKRKGD